MLDHQDKCMMKAQVHVSKSSTISDVQPLPRRKHYGQIYQMVKHMLRGRLLASFQDLEHKGRDTRSQHGIKDNDTKIQDHRRANVNSNEFPRTRLQVPRKAMLNDHPLWGDSRKGGRGTWVCMGEVRAGFGMDGVQIANQNANQNGNDNVVVARAEGNGNGNNINQIRCYNYRGLDHYARNYLVRLRRRDDAYFQTQLLIAQKEEAWIQLQAKEFDLMAVAGDIDEIEEVDANCILMANLQQASTSIKGTSVNLKFAKPSILGKPPLQPFRIQSVVRQPSTFQSERPKSSKTQFLPKVVETIELTKLVTSHSVPKSQESKVVTNTNVIAPRMFRINPRKNYRKDNYVPNKNIKQALGHDRSLFRNLVSSLRKK
nr:Gag-Pol polyprotein [Tanacetum cinerariifolium]